MDRPADELEVLVRNERTGKESCFAQDLESVADSEGRCPFIRQAFHFRHDRREPGYRTGPQIVAVGKAAGKDDSGSTGEVRFGVPHEFGVGAGESEGVDDVVFAVGPWEHDDGDTHVTPSCRLGDLVALDHRVRQQLRAHVFDESERSPSIGRLKRHRNDPSEGHLLNGVETEVTQRLVCRGTLRVRKTRFAAHRDLEGVGHRDPFTGHP